MISVIYVLFGSGYVQGQYFDSLELGVKKAFGEIKRYTIAYMENGITDIGLLGRSILITAITDTSVVQMGGSKLLLEWPSDADMGVVLGCFSTELLMPEWHITLSAKQVHRARITSIQEEVFLCVSFSGHIDIDGKRYMAEEEIDCMVLVLGQLGQIKRHFQVGGLNFSNIANNGSDILFTGGYFYETNINGKHYYGNNGHTYKFNDYYTCFSKVGIQKWLTIGSYFKESEWSINSYEWNREARVIHADDKHVFLANFSGIGYEYRVGDSTVKGIYENGVEFHPGYNLVVLDSESGEPKRVAGFETYNDWGIHFVFDQSDGRIKSLVGNDYALRLANNLGTSTYFPLWVNQKPVDVTEVYYVELSFGLDGVKVRKLDDPVLDASILWYTAVDESKHAYTYLFDPYLSNASKLASLRRGVKGAVSNVVRIQDGVPTFMGKAHWYYSNPYTLSDFLYRENQDVMVCYASSFSELLYYTAFYDNAFVEDWQIFVPNAFSPDGNGINDSFYLGYQYVGHTQWWIYNRWGALVWQGNQAWDGTVGGRPAAIGMYHFHLEYVDQMGNKKIRTGTFYLLK
ncbi:MAG: gliding motility-associated C-terminal domain-containing protein [Bacteroidetes bacterium]|nr:gliding motility-associated C-terminal domain-containing protein [Bacteroidota bacterium]